MRARRQPIHTSSLVIPMKKLTLQLDDLDVQSFDTTSAAHALRGTVPAHLGAASNDDFCSDACGSQIYSCYTCDTCDEACEPDDDGPDQQRRIILY
jgi:hypothetical protein